MRRMALAVCLLSLSSMVEADSLWHGRGSSLSPRKEVTSR
jgi:hypothetical protein